MQVIKFIQEHGFQALTTDYGISVKFVGNLVMLNYNQIESPKTHPIVIECRSLILEKDTLRVVSRSFDRFFNLGEALNVMPVIDWSRAEVFEKVDGSLIKVYFYGGQWNVSTRGTVHGESECMGHGITFAELVYKAVGVSNAKEFNDLMIAALLDPSMTYIFELTSVENRVVRHYTGYNLHFLSARKNKDGDYYFAEDERDWLQYEQCALYGRVKVAKRFNFTSETDAVNSAAQLKDLDEGYIVYQDGEPICKIKSPAYVAVHHIRGEGLSPKRISQLVLSNEQDEYLRYFPDDAGVIDPYTEAHENMIVDIAIAWDKTKDIVDQKEFAQAIAKHKFKGVLFNARSKGISVAKSFNEQRDTFKIDLLKGYVK